MTQSAVDFMAQPSTMFEPADPRPLRQIFLTADEFNAVAARCKKPIELGTTHAHLIVGSVEYVAEIAEACS